MLPLGPERMRRLRHEGEKAVQDALMIPDTLPALLVVAKAAEGLPWLLAGSLAVSCWAESRATVVIETLVPDEEAREALRGRLVPMPRGYEVRIRTAEELELAPDTVIEWHSRARREVVEGVLVFVPRPGDLLVALLAERGVIAAPAALYYACRLHQLHGPWSMGDADLSPYQCQRLAEAAALLINHAAEQLEEQSAHLHRVSL